jgi:hypothetical protein
MHLVPRIRSTLYLLVANALADSTMLDELVAGKIKPYP